MKYFIIASIFLLSACLTKEEREMAKTSYNMEWTLSTLNGKTIQLERPITIKIDDDQISGYGGCNRYSGKLNSTLPVFTAGPFVSTKMACMKGMAEEQNYLTTLNRMENLTVENDQLVLSNAAGDKLIFSPAE